MGDAELGIDDRAAKIDDQGRLRALVGAHFSFVWLSLRRLGVPEADIDDVCQRVFLRASERLPDIAVGTERAFLFRTALGMAANAKRAVSRRREVDLESSPSEPSDRGPGPDELADRRRARQLADEILSAMPLELSAVLILFEVEEMATAEIATLLDIPLGTVASRLRRAREDAQARLKRHVLRQEFRGGNR